MVIDTDILIDHFHGNAAATAFIKEALLSGQRLSISIAGVAEILAGMRPGEEEDTELPTLYFPFPNTFPLPLAIVYGIMPL